MNNEDEEFNRIEREAKQRIEAVKETIRYRDAFPKDYRLPKPWVGLTDEEFDQMLIDARFTRTDLMMIGACVDDIRQMIEAKLKEKNGM
jgi:hypothetical protein